MEEVLETDERVNKMNENINDLEKEINKLKEKLDEIKNSQINNYKLFKYYGFEWYIIDESDSQKLLFMKNSINPDKIKDYFKLDYMLDNWDYMSDKRNDVKFSMVNNGNWKDCYIRMVLNTTFLKKLNINELNIMKTDVNNETTSDYVRLITKEEIEKLPYYIRKNEDREFGYWTMSSYDDLLAWGVNRNGRLINNYPLCSLGVRPVISVSKSSAVLENCEKNEEA